MVTLDHFFFQTTTIDRSGTSGTILVYLCLTRNNFTKGQHREDKEFLFNFDNYAFHLKISGSISIPTLNGITGIMNIFFENPVFFLLRARLLGRSETPKL